MKRKLMAVLVLALVAVLLPVEPVEAGSIGGPTVFAMATAPQLILAGGPWFGLVIAALYETYQCVSEGPGCPTLAEFQRRLTPPTTTTNFGAGGGRTCHPLSRPADCAAALKAELGHVVARGEVIQSE